MEKPATLNCFVNNVSPVTVVIPANVANSATFNTSKSVCPSTSKLLVTSKSLVVNFLSTL